MAPWMFLVLVVIVTSRTTIVFAALKEIISVEWRCFYAGKMYKIGEEIRTEYPCLYCTCDKGWKGPNMYDCALIDCPWNHYDDLGSDCSLEYHKGECCPRYTCFSSSTTPTSITNFLLRLGKNIIFSEKTIRTINVTETKGGGERGITKDGGSDEVPCASVMCGFPCYPEPAGPNGCSDNCLCPQSVSEACEFLKCPPGTNCDAECNASPSHPYCVPFCVASSRQMQNPIENKS